MSKGFTCVVWCLMLVVMDLWLINQNLALVDLLKGWGYDIKRKEGNIARTRNTPVAKDDYRHYRHDKLYMHLCFWFLIVVLLTMYFYRDFATIQQSTFSLVLLRWNQTRFATRLPRDVGVPCADFTSPSVLVPGPRRWSASAPGSLLVSSQQLLSSHKSVRDASQRWGGHIIRVPLPIRKILLVILNPGCRSPSWTHNQAPPQWGGLQNTKHIGKWMNERTKPVRELLQFVFLPLQTMWCWAWECFTPYPRIWITVSHNSECFGMSREPPSKKWISFLVFTSPNAPDLQSLPLVFPKCRMIFN